MFLRDNKDVNKRVCNKRRGNQFQIVKQMAELSYCCMHTHTHTLFQGTHPLPTHIYKHIHCLFVKFHPCKDIEMKIQSFLHLKKNLFSARKSKIKRFRLPSCIPNTLEGGTVIMCHLTLVNCSSSLWRRTLTHAYYCHLMDANGVDKGSYHNNQLMWQRCE